MIYSFDTYELDLQRYELRYAGKLVKLEPQVFNVLANLVQHRDRVITKQELLDRLWPGRFVTEETLTSRLMAARKAIGDRGRGQRLIQTLHGRGYRFVAPVEERTPDATRPETQSQASSPVQIGPEPAPLSTQHSALSPVPIVGRQAELEHLRGWLQTALDGTRQIVFVTGEAGLGKTTVVDAFVE
jgi:DNA-binding winged helix-turn-helix (wHTH) protein